MSTSHVIAIHFHLPTMVYKSLIAYTLALHIAGAAPKPTPFSAPIRGFNSWQAFRYWITEEQVEAVASALSARSFVVSDDC